MQMISSRIIPFLNTQSLATDEAREALILDDAGRFLLYLCVGELSPSTEERVIILGSRETLLWLNELPQDQGSFWE